MSSDFYSRDEVVDRGSVPLDIDDVHMLLQVEQEQIQKKTFTNWVNAQLAKRRPPCMILDLFQDFRDGSRLLDLLEVMSGQRLSRERGHGMFQHRSNIEKALSFLKAKSIKLVNINIPDIIDGKPSIILGLIWTIILQYHIEELASSLSFSSRQSSMESLASLDSRSTLSSRSASSSPVPPRGSPLHRRFRVSAKKALLLWVREQCHKAGCTLNVKDFKTSWRSGVVFLAILYALRPDVVDLSKARTRSNRQNLEEAFRVAESELRIPKLLDPDDVDVRDPDEKSIMTYVAQFLQYSKDLPVAEEDVQTQYLTLPKSPSPVSLPLHYTPAVSASPLRQASPDQKVKEVTCWLLQALDELLEGWDSTEGESYAERYHVFHTFVVSFSEQRRSVIPLLTATRRSPNPSREQRALREAWDALAEKLRDYRIQLDTSLPAPLDAVARWLLKTEGALGEEETDPQDHGRAADDAKEKQELLKVCLEEMPQHLKTFQSFQNMDHDGNMMVPSDKLDELKRRFTSVRVSAKYHGIKLEYRELRHTALDLLGQIRNKLQVWKRPYIAPEAVRVLLQEWHECVNTRQLPSMLESTLHKLKQVSEKYSSKSALAADYPHVSQQVKQLEEDGAAALAGVATAKSIMGRVLSAWESYGDCLSSLQAWLEQNSVRLSHGHGAEVTAECLAEWESRRARLTEAGTFLMEFTDPQTSRILEEELRRFHLRWTEFTRTNSFAGMSSADTQVSTQDVQTLVRESTLILKEPLEAMTGPLHTYRKRLQLIIRKLQEVDFDALSPSSECPADHLQKLKFAVPEVLQTLLEAEQVCAELLHSVSGLDWRLAELHFWITEAREVYQHLKTSDRQRRGQDPRARVLISRGLQLEGQVVTEDQDLQVMVMTSQKNSPIQYLHASAMQERVRGAVAQSQEVVGMLSSLGARRDRSRSPSEGRPPTKVFIQGEKTQRQVDSGPGCLSPQVQFKSQQCHDPFLPKIVVQEYSEEKMPSALSVCAQSLMANEGISGARDQSHPQTHQQSQEEEMVAQQQPLQQVQQPEPGAQKQQWQRGHQQPEQHPRKYPVQKQSEAKIQVQEEPDPSERASAQEQGAVKLPLTPQELQSRKAKAAKNRPWLQKPAERLGAQPDSSQANVESIRAQPEPPVQGVPQQSKKELKKKEQEQVQLVRSLSDPSTESTTAPFTQPPLKKKFPSQPQAKVGVQPAPQTAGQALPEVAYSPTGGQPPPKTVSQTQSQDQPQTRVQTHLPAEPQLSTPSQGLVPQPVIAHAQIWAQVRPSSPMQASLHGHIQPPVPSHIQLRSHPPSWAPVRPPSPKPPTHPQSHMQTTVQPGTMTQPMTQNAPLDPQPQGHPRPLTTVQYSDHFSQSQIPHWTQVGASTSVAVPQLHAKMQPLFYPQGYVQGQAPAQPWVPQQEPHIQAVPQQRHPISQAYPQQMDQAPESQGHPTGTVPPQWPLGPPLGPSGYSVELSYTQPRMQTEALPQVINWSSSTQAQMTTYDDLFRIQTHPGQVQQQTWVQTSSQPQDYSHTWPQMPLQPLAQQHIIAQSPLEVKPRQLSPDSQLPAQTRSQMHSTSESPEKCKNSAQLPPQGELQSPVRSKPPPVTEPSFPTEPMGQSAFKAESSPPTQHVPPTPQVTSQPHPKDQAQGQVKDDLCDQAEVEVDVAPLPPEYPSPIQHQVQSPAQPKVMSPAQPGPPGPVSTSPEAQTPSQPRPEGQSQAKPPTPSPPRAQKSQTLALYQEDVLPPGLSESPDLCDSPLTLSQALPQAYTEAYTKAQALARNGFEEAKHCLQEHILETISVFEDKSVSAEQASLKEETLRTLDPELLEEFLRAAKGMEAFCSPSQLRNMEFYTQCVRTQWEDVRAEISDFLQQLSFEVTRKHFNTAALQCELHLRSQACISADSSFVEAGRHLQALKELCDTLSPEDAHRLAQTQLRECQTRLADIQRQFSGDQDVPLSDSRIPAIFSESLLTQREAPGSSDSPQISEASPVTMKTVPAERIAKQQASEEEVKKREGLESRYDNCKRTLQAQLAKNELSITEVPPESVSLNGLHTRLQEIQFLRQETESLWAEYTNQCSQLSGTCHMEQEKEGLQEEWSRQQSALQRRGSSLAAALRQIDSTQNHLVDFSDRLNRYLRQPKDIAGFTLVNSNILRDIKDLDDNIQSELGQLGRLDPDSSDLDPRDCFPLSSEVKAHRTSLDHLRQQVRKSEAAARALDRFLMSLRTLDEDVSGVHSAPSGDAQLLQDSRSKLAVMRQSVDSLKEKAPQLDLLLQGARLTVTRDGAPASCLDMVAVLLRRLDEADAGLASQQRTLQKENQSKSLGLRKRTLLAELRTLQDSIERQSLKEPTIPAVQHRLRALTELEGPLQTHQSELHDLRDLQEEQGGGENLYGELEAQWKETQKAFSDRKKQCNILLDLLKKFQSCRGHLSSTMQTAEQAVNEQASYMGKDYLQRSITKVSDIKEGLSGLGETIEEMRSVCRQLQSELKKSPDCSETSFEAEADALMDNWLDVTEKTDAYLDNLRVGLELWEKQLSVGGEVDSWAGAKLALFAESHPFHNQQNVSDMKEEICKNEENIEHFHKKSVEIQEMLQSREAPLELQVMEGQLRKRMQQVKELFHDCADVFEELIAVKTHLAEKIEECHSAVENIQSSLNEVDGSESNVEDQIQNLCDELEAQEEQAEAVLKEVGMVSSVASPQVMEALSVDCRRLREAISHTKDLIHLKREERDKGLIQVLKDGRQSFEGWFQDLQLSVNECFENPESKTDVEVYLQRLAAFLKSKDADRRLDHLKDQLQRGGKQIPPEQQTEVTEWLREQRGEVSTFRSHCHNRQQQMESLLSDLSSLQKQHDSFRDWLQTKEKQSVELDKVGVLLKDLQEESGRAEDLGELLGSVRRQGVRAEGLLKDSDNLIQRYRNLSVRLEERAEAQNVLQGECDMFKSQAESTRTWITELLKPLSDPDHQPEEMIYKAQTVLSSKQEGDYKMDDLRRQGEHLCEQETLETVQKQKIQQSVGVVEEQWRNLLQTAEEVLNKAQTEAETQQQVDSFKSQIEDVQMWIRDQKKKLMSTSSHMPFDERIQIVKAVLSNRAKGESMVTGLKSRCDALQLQESVRAELQRLVGDAEQQWRTALQMAGQAELRTLSEDFDAQSQNTQSWIREKQQQLQTVGAQTPPEERSIAAQTILISKPDGDCQVNNLRRRSQTLFDHTDADEGRKLHAQKLVRDAEETWRTVLMAAKHVEAAASAEITQRTEQKQLELSELDVHLEDVNNWLSDQKQQVDLLSSQTRSEDVMNSAQTIMSCKAEGDAKLQELKRRVQSASNLDIEEPKKQELQQQLRRAEEQWMSVVQTTKQNLDQAEKQRTLNVQLSDFRALSETTRTWLEDKQQSLETLASQADPETAINDTQAVLSCKPDGDSRLLELRRHSKSLLEQPDLEEHVKQQVHHTVQDSEEQWRRVLQSAEDNMKKAEVQYSLSRELEAFRNQAKSTSCWVKELQQEAESKGSGTQGSKAQIEDRLSTAQAVLSRRSSGEAQVTDLRRRAESLCGNSSLDGDRKLEVEQTARDAEERWRLLLEAAEDAHRQLTAVADLIQSCQTQRVQAEGRLSEIKRQVSSVPRLFPWPGLGERRQALEQAQMLLDRTAAMAPVLSDVRKQTAELFEITQDQSCTDPSWADKEESIPALLRELTDVVAELDQGILAERQCTQLVEQHDAAQDWLRDQVKSLTAPPEDREGLHSAVNTLKALLLTVDREQREMTELDLARDSLMNLCSPGGQDALALAVGHLHNLCDASEQELRERLTACEAALAELDQLTRRSQGLKERAAAIQWELRSLDQALGSSEAQNNVDSLQQRWNSLQNCQKSLGDLGVKVQDLHQEVQDFLGSDELPTDISALVDALCQQHDSLKSRLRENQDTCCADSARCLTEHLHALQEWSRSRPARSTSSLQMSLEAGEQVQASLQEGLSHQQFLKETLTSALLEKLERNASDALREAETHRTSLKESLKELEESSEDVAQDDAEQTSRKKSNEKTEEEKKVPSTEESASFKDDVSANLQNKDTHRLAPVTEDTLMKVDLSPEALPSEDMWKMMGSEALPSEDTLKMKVDLSSEALPSEDTLKMKVDLSSEALPSEDTWKMMSSEALPSEDTLKMKVDLSSEALPSEDTLMMKVDLSPEALPSEDTLMMKVDLSSEALPSEDTWKMMRSEALPSEDTLKMKVDLSSEALPSEDTLKMKVDLSSEALPSEDTLKMSSEALPSEDTLMMKVDLSSEALPSEDTLKMSSEALPSEDTLKMMSSEALPSEDTLMMKVDLSTEALPSEDTLKMKSSEALPSEDTLMMKVDLSSGLAEDQEKSTSSMFSVEPIKAAVGEDSESLKPLGSQDEQQAAVSLMEKTESVETKLIPTRRKSKNSGPNESLQKLQSEENSERDGLRCSSAVTEPTGDNRPPPRKRSAVDLKLSSESASQEETESEREPGAQTSPLRALKTETVAEEAKETPATIQDVSDASTEVVKTADPEIPKRKKSKSFEVSTVSESVAPLGGVTDLLCEAPAELENVHAQDESAGEQNKPLPPKRKSKSTDLPLKSVEHQTKEDPEVQCLTPSGTLVEETKLVPTRRRSKNGQVSIISETVPHLGPDNVEPQPSKKEVNSQNSSNTGLAVTAALVEENKAKLSPTQRKSKGPKHPPEPATKGNGKAIKEAGRQQSLEKTEGKLTPLRRRSKASLPVIESESKDAGKESKSRSISSATQGSTLTSETTVLAESKLLTTARKSQSPKISPNPSQKDDAKASEKQGKVGQVSETPSGEETQVAPTRKSKESVKSQKSTEQNETVEKGKLSPVKRKPKGLKPSKEFPTRDVAKSDAQYQSSSPKTAPDKAKSTFLEKGKLSPTKRKSKAGKASKELSSTELPKTKEAPDEVREPSNISESADEEMLKLSPTERESKELKVSSQSPDEWVQNPEESYIQALSSASDVHKTAAENTIEENSGISPDKDLTGGLKECSDLSEPEVTNTTEESDAEKKLSSPEDVTPDNTSPEVPDRGSMQTKEELDAEKPQSPVEVPTEVTDIKPLSEDWKPTSELSDQEIKARRDSDGEKSSSTAEEDESDGHDISSVGTEKEPMLEHETELVQKKVEGVASEMELKADNIYGVSRVTEAPEPPSEVSANELTGKIEACSAGMLRESTEISVLSVSKLLGETPETTDGGKGMSSSTQKHSPEAVIQVTQPEERSDRDTPGQVDTDEHVQLTEDTVTIEATGATQPKEGEEVPAPETSAPVQRNSDGTPAAPERVGSLTQTVSEGPPSEVEVSTNTVEEQNRIPSMENDLSRLSNEPTNAPSLSEYIDTLWKDTDETEKRYMVLDLPEVSFSQTSDRAPDHQETVVERLSEQDTKNLNETQLETEASAAEEETEKDTVEAQHGGSQEVLAQTSLLSEAAHPTEDMVESSGDVGTLKQILTQIPTKEEVKEETPDTLDTMDVWTKQIHLDPEVRVLHLDTAADLEERNTTETGERADVCIQGEEAPEGEMIITADVALQEPSAEKPDVILKESSVDVPGGSAESITPSEFIEISIYETSPIETSREPLEGSQICPAPVQEQQVREEPEVQDENYVKMEKIEKGSEVHIFQQDTQIGVEEEIMSVKITKEPALDLNLSVQCGKDLVSDDVLPETDTVELTVLGVGAEEQDLQEQAPVQGGEQVSGIERTTADLLATGETTGEEAQQMKGPEQKQLISSQNLTYLEFEQEAHTEVKEEAVSDAKVSPRDVHDAADSLAGVEPKEESSISLETVNEGKGVTTNEVQSEGTIVMGGASESSALPVPADQKATDAKESDQDANKNIPGPKMDTMEIEVVSLVLPMVKTTSTLEEMASMASPQEVESSSEVICAEQIWTEGTSSLQTHAEAGKDAQPDTQTTMLRSFREVQELWGTEPHSQLLQGMQQEDGPEALMTTSSDLENCRNRLVSKVLSCKNHPIRLEVTAMAQQLQEAQECRDAAQSRLTGLSEARAADADGSDDLDLMEDKWSAALQDAAAVIQQKEAELQLVTDYSQQSQSAKITLESLKMQLGAAQMSPEESSSEQRERLSSLKKETEECRASLERMVVAFDTLAPHLSQSERMTAQNEIRDLQESWSSLERDIDRTLIQTELYSVETSNLLSSISNLHTNLETICKDVEAKYPDAQWSCRKAKELLVANAEVKAAQQQHLQLQRLSEPLSLNSCWEKELTEVQQGLQKVRDQLAHTEGLVTSCMQRSGNPIMEKMMVVMKDGLSWAKQTECIIEGRRTKVALLPEEVHQQLRDLKKLQLEVIAKQGQLRTLVEEVTELLPELDQAEEVPVVNSTLELLQELSKLTTEKLTSAVGQVESGLQTREKLTEQIADLDSWVMAHLLREASKSADEDLSLAELDRRSGQTQENVVEAEKQLTVCEDLLMKINYISSELSITENSKLLKKLTNLKEDIQAIRNYERANKKDLNDHTQVIALSNEGLNTVEKSLMQMLVDVGRHRYPITKDSLQALEPLKHMVLEHKLQIDLLQPWVPQERVKELYSVVSELLSKMAALERNSRDHETYLSMRQCVEDLRENIQEQVHQTKGDSMGQEERYKLCQTLILKIPLIKSLSEETHSKLQMISASLYPSQLNAEQQRLKLHQESLETLEVTLHNNLSIIERDVLEDLDLDSEEKATLAFLQRTQKELQRTPVLEPDEAAVQKEYQKIMTLKVMIKSRMRVVEFLRTRKRPRLEGEFQNLKDLKDKVISECDSQMVNISQAREPLRSYTCAVKQAAQFLRDIELSLQPPQGPAGLCSERIEETQRAVHALQHHFQTHVEHLQDQVIVHPYLSPQKVQQLQETILSQLLVRMSTLQAKGHIQLEHLSRCAENNRKYTQCHEETLQSVKDIEENLLQVTRQKLASLADCVEQHDQLTTLGEEVEAQLRCLKDLKECCTEQSCYRRREATLAALWRRLSRLHHCTWKLAARSEDRITEWSEISDTVEKVSVVLEQVEAELPDGAGVKASSEELQDLLQSWEQYQDRLDCEQRALSALELRTARLLGVPAHLEQAPPTPLCQKLQMMQARYRSVKKRSSEGLEVARMELEEREKVREELHGVQLWLEAADVLLNEMEQGRSTEELQEVHRQLCTQKALLQAMMDRMKRKYSDVQLLVPVELHGLLQEVQQSVQELEVKVVEAVDRSGPAYRLDAKLSEIQTGLRSVRQKLEQRSSTVAQAEDTQKHVWDELDTWHSCLAQLESDAQDLEKPEDTVTITDKLTEVQQLHSQLAKQAEQRTALIGKVTPWLQEHQEMINSSDSWMSEAQSWLAAPCTYAGAKCLSGRVRALQRVLDDSAQIRTALQGFASVLEEMSQVCDVTALQEQLLTADSRVAEVQERFTAPLSQLQHAVTKVESIEREVRQLEKDVAEIKKVLVSPESCPSLQKQRFKMVEQRVGSMRATVAQIQRCKADLGLPGNAEETLTVFTVVNQLQSLLQDLEKKVPALFTQQPLNPAQSRVLTAEQTSSSSPISESSHLEAERDQTEGRIGIAHLGEDVLKRSGAALLTVERPEQRSPDAPQEPEVGDADEAQVGQTGEHAQGAEQLAEATEAGASEASSEPSGPVRTQPESHSMVKTDSAEKLSKPTSGAQQRCVIS